MSSGAKGLVLDTNVLISAAIFPHSMAARTLSLAVSAGADIIVSGDKAHVLSMHPYRGIDILSLADFYRLMTQDTPL